MGSKTTKTTSKEQATTTPNLAPYTSAPIENYYNKVGGLMNGDPAAFAPQSNALLDQAMMGAKGLNANVLPQLANHPSQYQVSNVAKVAAPNFMGATVAEAPKAAQVAPVSLGAQMMAGGGASDAIERAKSESLLDNLGSYMNPYINDVVNTTLAGQDQNAAADRGAYMAQAAGRGAFGGSRQALGETALIDNQARARAAMEAGLRSDAFNTGAQLSNLDAGRRQEVGMFNAGQFNDRTNLNAQLGTQASIANASNANSRDIALAQLAGQLGMFNAGAKNDFGLAQFNALNDTSRFNAGEANDLFSQIYGTQNANAQQNASAANQAKAQFYDTQAETSRFNADQLNDVNLANVGNQRANVGLQADLGAQLMEIQRQQQMAPYTQAGVLGELLMGGGLLPATTGQTINSNGTSTQKQSGGLLQSLLAAGGQLGSAAIMASERRVKRDIIHLGNEDDGLPIYAWNYVEDDPEELPRFGPMADEVARFRPWALGPIVDGVQTVNYAEL